jgi:hypothetical protein
MSNGNVKFHRCQSSSKRGIRISIKKNDIWFLAEKSLLNALNHFGGLSAMASGPNLQIYGWLPHAKLLKEDPGHGMIVVLTRVKEAFFDTCFGKSAANRPSLYELGPRPDDC